MRRIKSEKEIQARQKKIQLFVGISIAVLLLLSTIGYFASELFGGDGEVQPSNLEYGGRTYIRQNDILVLLVEDKPFYFANLPNESRGIYSDGASFQNYSGKPLYIVNMQSSAQRILINLDGIYSRWQTACLEEGCEENLPVKNCTDNLMVFMKANETRVEQNENCVFFYGDFEKGVDAFSYGLLGIK